MVSHIRLILCNLFTIAQLGQLLLYQHKTKSLSRRIKPNYICSHGDERTLILYCRQTLGQTAARGAASPYAGCCPLVKAVTYIMCLTCICNLNCVCLFKILFPNFFFFNFYVQGILVSDLLCCLNVGFLFGC